MNIIINPTAGGKKGKKIQKILTRIEKRLTERKIEYSIHYTKYKGHGTILTDELIKGGAKDIVVMGGDGTLHEVINGFSNFENVNLGLIPCGTGNDFARALNLPKDPVKALDLIIDNEPQFTDFLQLPTVRGINIVCMGIDVDVLIRYSKLKHKNKLGYTWCLIKTLMNFHYTDFTAKIDGQDKRLNLLSRVWLTAAFTVAEFLFAPSLTPPITNLNFWRLPKLKVLLFPLPLSNF